MGHFLGFFDGSQNPRKNLLKCHIIFLGHKKKFPDLKISGILIV
jgi:hypothetical protein